MAGNARVRRVLFKALPFVKDEVTLALEAGVDGLIVPGEALAGAGALARILVLPEEQVSFVALDSKADEERTASLAASAGASGPERLVVLVRGWEIIPLENLLAQTSDIAVEAATLDEAVLAREVLERGVDTLVVVPDGLPQIREMVQAFTYGAGSLPLSRAVITRIAQAGMGHRVCVDTTSLMRRGQGMLVGNSSAFTFLVNAETEPNEYVASRPFRVNAGGVHAYALMPGDRTAYLDELAAGREVLIVDQDGSTGTATVGRVKVERRPMLLVEARLEAPEGTAAEDAPMGAVFLQNAETIRLVTPDGRAVSVVDLKPGDKVLCRVDAAGRHFGMRISEEIKEG